jgi:NADP-dependent 3-hydroxy acid dehydrogenase YdfG
LACGRLARSSLAVSLRTNAEFARQLAARGSNLILAARSADRLAALAEDLQARHRVTVTTLPADLSLPADVSRVVAATAATRVDLLVNNAGFGTYGSFAGLDPAREHAEVMVNAVAAVGLAHAVLPGMLTRRTGGIITVASTIAFQPSPQQAVYGATKAFAWRSARRCGPRPAAAGSASSRCAPGRPRPGSSPASATRTPPPASSTGAPPTRPASSGPAWTVWTTTR